MDKENLKGKRKLEEHYKEIDDQVAVNHYYQHEVVMERPSGNNYDGNNQDLGAHDQDQLGDNQCHVLPSPQYPMRIPSGFVFAPTKVELLYHYLYPKIMNPGFIFGVPSIREANIYQCHPQQLLEGTEEDSAYFFTRITRKGGKASRTVGGYGYWRISTTDSIEEGGAKVGEKNTLAFYTGFQSDKKKNKTNWLMQEYSFCKERNGEEWVVCRIYLKKGKK